MDPLHPLETHPICFPEGVYSDVRLERTADHQIIIRDGQLDQVVTKVETGALIRVLKGGQWYIASTTDLDAIDEVLAELAASDALPPTDRPSGISALEVIDEAVWAFDDARIDAVPVSEKLALLRHHARAQLEQQRPGVQVQGQGAAVLAALRLRLGPRLQGLRRAVQRRPDHRLLDN